MISIPGRIKIRIFPFFWVLIFMLGWLNTSSLIGSAIWAVVILISVLVHEYGHALTALAFGQSAEIHLVALGGVTQRQGMKLSSWKESIIIFNGPLAGFMLFIGAKELLPFVNRDTHQLLWYALLVAENVNLFWTIMNLFPVMPLDGGHLLQIALSSMFGQNGLKISCVISTVLAAIIGVIGFISGQLWIGALFLMLAFENYRTWSDLKTELISQHDDQELQTLVANAVQDLQAGNLDEALHKVTLVREQAPKGNIYVVATQYGAHILAQQGKYKKAYDWLFPLKNRLSPEYIHLLQQLAYRVQQWEEAVEIGQEAYQKQPSLDSALLNALSYAIMGKATPALGWLTCAVQHGLPNIQQVIEKREFDAVRHTPEFKNWLAHRT